MVRVFVVGDGLRISLALDACLVFCDVLGAEIWASEVAFEKYLTTFIHIIQHHLRGGLILAILNLTDVMIHVKQFIFIVVRTQIRGLFAACSRGTKQVLRRLACTV